MFVFTEKKKKHMYGPTKDTLELGNVYV